MKPYIALDYPHRWLTFTTGAFLGFLFGVILGLSSCQSAACPSSPVGMTNAAGKLIPASLPPMDKWLRMSLATSDPTFRGSNSIAADG